MAAALFYIDYALTMVQVWGWGWGVISKEGMCCCTPPLILLHW